MHRGQRDTLGLPRPAQLGAQPRLEQRRVRLQHRQLGDRGQVVALGRTVHSSPMRVEGRQCRGHPHRVVQPGQDLGGRCTAIGEPLQALDVGGERLDPLGFARCVETAGEAAQRVERRLFGDPPGDVRSQRARRVAQCLFDVDPRQGTLGRRQTQPGQRSAYRGAIGELGTHAAVGVDAGQSEGDLHGRQQGVDPRQHGDLVGRASLGQRGPDQRHRRRDRIATTVDRHPGRARSGADRLWHTASVVLQQHRRGGDDVGRTAVVHLQRMVTGMGEVLGEVDQPLGIGPVEPVDRLVVVADPEHTGIWSGQQSDEQVVGRCQVLELVDEQHPAGPLGCGAGSDVGEQDLDCPNDLFVVVDRTRPRSVRGGTAAASPRTRRCRRRRGPPPRADHGVRGGPPREPRSTALPGRSCACAGTRRVCR